MGLYKQVDNASFEQLKLLWDASLPDWADSRELYLEEISCALSEVKPEGIKFLKEHAYAVDVEKRSNAIYFLAYKEIVDEEIIGYLIDAFQEDDKRLKTSALWGFIHIEKFPIARPLIEKLMESKDERLAALAMVYLSNAYPDERVNILRCGFASENPRKREYGCDEVGDRCIYELSEELYKLLDDRDEYVQQAAKSNLEMLKG